MARVADVNATTEAGFVLAGGGQDQDAAMKWMIERAGGGDFVIIRAGGSTGYNNYLFEMGGLNSVKHYSLIQREKAMSEEVGQRIREAEALFIAGGDQWNYVNYWKDSEVSAAIQYLIEEKKIPIGGTSAGCAVLSEYIFDAQHDTVLSADALVNPYAKQVSVSKSFIKIPFLVNTIVDQHYSQRERQGRHIAFMARMMKDFQVIMPKGIAADEKTAVCIDKTGNVTVFGSGNVYFLSASSKPEVCEEHIPLEWNNNQKAVEVYTFQASLTGTPVFNLLQWPTNNPNEYWSVSNGQLQRIKN
ncbi:MAG: cyanophycinase [Cytophagales bacterium]|nr:cyanophycinase [Cytophagales bacterium]